MNGDMGAREPEPLIALWTEYQTLDAAANETCHTFSLAEGEYFASKPSGLTDEEDKAARDKAGVTVLEETSAAARDRADAVLQKIAAAPVTSLEGIAITLRAVTNWRDERPGDRSGQNGA